uniref:Uncharacterized protein n=1 Tax=Arundo donax TaxID=35708 RepID=A0A0A8Y1K8_ARUDO
MTMDQILLHMVAQLMLSQETASLMMKLMPPVVMDLVEVDPIVVQPVVQVLLGNQHLSVQDQLGGGGQLTSRVSMNSKSDASLLGEDVAVAPFIVEATCVNVLLVLNRTPIFCYGMDVHLAPMLVICDWKCNI